MEESTHLHSKKDSDVTDMDEYQNPVGSLTKPDQTCHMSVLSQFMTTTLQTHIKAAIKILWYLQGTNHVGIFFPKQNNMQLIAHSWLRLGKKKINQQHLPQSWECTKLCVYRHGSSSMERASIIVITKSGDVVWGRVLEHIDSHQHHHISGMFYLRGATLSQGTPQFIEAPYLISTGHHGTYCK
jgi:hypothetical protein